MNYRLVVLTHRNAEPLPTTIRSFADHVSPRPSSVLLRWDRPTVLDPAGMAAGIREYLACAVYSDWHTAAGFCESSKRAWAIAVSGMGIPHPLAEEAAYEHVFWLEHDFVFTRNVDLRDLAAVLDTNQGSTVAVPEHMPGNPSSTGLTGYKTTVGGLAQMALMRNAVNNQEKAAGGLFESRPGQYMARGTACSGCGGELAWVTTTPPGYSGWACTTLGGCSHPPLAPAPVWLEHRSYFTTNPSLMRRAFMAEHPWPDYPDQCEGRFGIDLIQAGYSFGVWGDGSPWVEHIGAARTGFGY